MSELLNLPYLLEGFLDNELPMTRTEPRRDRFGSSWLHTRDLGGQTDIRYGRVVDVIAFAHAYKVHVDGNHVIWCSSINPLSSQPFGSKTLSTYSVGTPVFFLWYPAAHWGFIIGAIPEAITDPRFNQSDFISQCSRSGLLVDRAHSYVQETLNGGMLPNWSAFRPMDGTSIGEWGAITETGLAVYLDPYMAFLRADEETGVWAFYHDQLLRIAGHNYQQRSALTDHDEVDDESEVSSFRFTSPYPWERLGAFAYTSAPNNLHRELGIAAVEHNTPEYSRFEPKFDDQQPFMRRADFEGYLGQGFKRTLAAPPYPLPTNVNRYSLERKLIGLFEENLALTGAYSMRSAKRIILSKRPSIPIPKQMILPNDSGGDTKETYKAAGLLGTGDPHKIVGDPLVQNPDGEPAYLCRASMVLDMNAFAFNWEGAHPFHYHEADWYLPEEGETGQITSNNVHPLYSALATQQYLAPPNEVTSYVDHRYSETGNVRYFMNESYIDMLDDGGICISDGFGSEIKMTGGQIFLSAPGDIFIQAGKNVNAWAGWDFIAKAYNSADITTSRKDIRLKAEHDLMMLAGNDECGGVLIESRSKCPAYDFDGKVGEDVNSSGIFLRATRSRVVTYANDVTTIAGTNPEDPKGGVSIDASGRRVKIFADYCERFITTAAFDFFIGYVLNGQNTTTLTTCDSSVLRTCPSDLEEGPYAPPPEGSIENNGPPIPTIKSVNEYWADGNLLGNQLAVQGKAFIDGCLSVNDWISVKNGHIATELSGEQANLVASLKQDQIDRMTSDFSYSQHRQAYLIGVGIVEADVVNRINDLFVFDVAVFSLRNQNQYRTQGFTLFESRWQQLNRFTNGNEKHWHEPPVYTGVFGNHDTYPYPGREAWRGTTSDSGPLSTNTQTVFGYRWMNPRLYDISSGVSLPRGANQALYEDAKLNTPVKKVLENVYPIIRTE